MIKICQMAAITAAVAITACSAQAATITSGNFSLGYGMSVNQVWDTTETAGANTPTTMGDFTFTTAVTGPVLSAHGPTFPNRVLSDGTANSSSSGYPEAGFGVSVTGSYNGPAPVDAAAIPNYRVILEISQISIWAARGDFSEVSIPNSIAWTETTAGHPANSPDQAIENVPWSAGGLVAANYRQLLWDAPDYQVPLANLNDLFTRTFDIPPINADDFRVLDGVEVLGRVHLVYDAIPEPGSLTLIGLVAVPMLMRRRT